MTPSECRVSTWWTQIRGNAYFSVHDHVSRLHRYVLVQISTLGIREFNAFPSNFILGKYKSVDVQARIWRCNSLDIESLPPMWLSYYWYNDLCQQLISPFLPSICGSDVTVLHHLLSGKAEACTHQVAKYLCLILWRHVQLCKSWLRSTGVNPRRNWESWMPVFSKKSC